MLDPVIAPLAHVGGGVFEPLQLLPPLAALAAYWMRARTLAKPGPAGAGLADGLLRRRDRADRWRRS